MSRLAFSLWPPSAMALNHNLDLNLSMQLGISFLSCFRELRLPSLPPPPLIDPCSDLKLTDIQISNFQVGLVTLDNPGVS